MIRNYIKTAWRNINKNRTYAAINILGLTIGLTACMLMATVVLDDLSYDKHWSRKDDLYRILTVDTAGLMGKSASALANLGNEFKNNFPEVEAVASVRTWENQFRLKKEDDQSIEMQLVQADTNVWKLLDIHILEGHPQEYVAGQANLVISESFRDKHFKPNENPVGKTIYSISGYNDEPSPFLITGVMANLPQNTYLRAEGLQLTRPRTMELNLSPWGFYDEQLMLMKPGTDMAAFTEKANRWYRGYLTEATEAQLQRLPIYQFQPIEKIYLHSDFAFQRVKGNPGNIYIFSGVSILLLTIACINFINLSTAGAIRRMRETGVRKVLGAGRKQLIGQFLTESLLFFVLSGLAASLLYMLALGSLEKFIGHGLTLHLLGSSLTAITLLSSLLLISLLTGVYPAWVLSGEKIIHTLKNQLGTGKYAGTLVRKSLIVSQFGIAILVLIGMATVWRQMQFMQEKSLGYEAAHVLNIPQFAPGSSAGALKHEISRIPGVQQVSLAGWTPTIGTGSMSKHVTNPRNPEEKTEVNFMAGDTDFASVLGFKLLEGRFFDERERNTGFNLQKFFSGNEEDKLHQMQQAKALITKSTAAMFDVTELGHPIKDLDIIPIGIIEDFHTRSLHDPVPLTVVMVDEEPTYANFLIAVAPGQEAAVASAVHQVWKQFHPDKPFQLDHLQSLVDAQYEKEAKQQQLLGLFSSLMLFLAALGVYGMIVHATGQRTKEIGVRKVLGASVTSIVRLFSVDYVQLVLIAALIASPIAWWLMNKWLEDFTYRIDVQWWVFALAGLVALAVALLTVSGQAIRAAVANPVDSLRDE